MASAEILAAFLIGTLVYATVPGPGTVYVTAQAVAHDTRAALKAALGLHLGGYVIVFASAAGLTALFSLVPILYEGLKLLGALYLIWLGLQIIVFKTETRAPQMRSDTGRGFTPSLTKSALVEVLNPTTAVFYVAFLPQFIDPAGALPVWAQFTILGAVVNLIFSLPDVTALLITARIKEKAGRNRLGRRVVQWIAGTVLIALGVRLAASRA